jgi:hypothetical protein
MTPLKTEVEAKQPETKHEEPKPRFQPIKLRGGSPNAGSEEVIHGRGRDPHSNEKSRAASGRSKPAPASETWEALQPCAYSG